MSNPFRTVFPVVLLAFAMTHATSAVADDAHVQDMLRDMLDHTGEHA